MIAYFKDNTHKSKKKYKKFKTKTTKIKSFDTFVIIETTSSSITLSLTGIGLIVISISTATTCGLSIGNNVIFEIITYKYNEYKSQYERDEQTIKCFDKLYRKSLQDNVIEEIEYESLCDIFTKYLKKQKFNLFINMNLKLKLFFFSHSNLKLNLEPKSSKICFCFDNNYYVQCQCEQFYILKSSCFWNSCNL